MRLVSQGITEAFLTGGTSNVTHRREPLKVEVYVAYGLRVGLCVPVYLMVVVEESFPTAIRCSPSWICWAQGG